jgi:proteasome lid subunit RPN8/RPN11
MGVTYAVEENTREENNTVCGGIDFAHLPHRELVKLSGPRTAAFQVVVRQSALNRVYQHGNSSMQAEVCGVLVGDVYRDETGAFVLVEHIIEGASSTGSAGQVTFTADTWQHIQTLMDKQYPDLRIVGWYHTHPGHGVFLSDMDVFLHESFFGLPWQLALVYDPRNIEEGVFNAQEGKSHRLEYNVEADEPAGTVHVHKAPVAPEPVVDPIAPPRKAPVVIRKRRWIRFWYPLRQFVLAVIGLTLFTVMGVLLGLLIRMQHIEIPNWIQRMAHG